MCNLCIGIHVVAIVIISTLMMMMTMTHDQAHKTQTNKTKQRETKIIAKAKLMHMCMSDVCVCPSIVLCIICNFAVANRFLSIGTVQCGSARATL